MRATIGHAVRHPSYLPDWWCELPGRRAHWWRWLLLEPGNGWLRWKNGEASGWYSMYEPPESYPVAPPLHRVWYFLSAKARHPFDVARGLVAWNEWTTWADIAWMRDEQRSRGTR